MDIVALRDLFFVSPYRERHPQPSDTIRNFFSQYRLTDMRNILWQLLETNIAGEDTDTHKLLPFFEQLGKMLEAACMAAGSPINQTTSITIPEDTDPQYSLACL